MNKLTVVLILCLFPFFVFAQEEKDSLTLYSTPIKANLQQFSFDRYFDISFPMSDPYVVNQLMLNQLFDYKGETVEGRELSVTPYNSFYLFSNEGFSYWQNSIPFAVGFSYHLGDAFGWKKLDAFVDGSGVSVNDYSVPEAITAGKRMFIWEAGAGVGYKIGRGSTVFIKGSVQYGNFTPMGEKSLGGVNVKF